MQRSLQQAKGVEPSARELAVETGMSAEKLAMLHVHARTATPISLDKSVGEDRDQTMHDLLAPKEAIDTDQSIDLGRWRADLNELLSGLSSIEATTLRLRFGLDGGEELTLQEIGGKYNLSRERIRQTSTRRSASCATRCDANSARTTKILLPRLLLARAQRAGRPRIGCGLSDVGYRVLSLPLWSA